MYNFRVVQDVLRPARQAAPIGTRFSQRRRVDDSPRRGVVEDVQIDSDDVPLGPPLVLLDPDSLKNPNSRVRSPEGPPTPVSKHRVTQRNSKTKSTNLSTLLPSG